MRINWILTFLKKKSTNSSIFDKTFSGRFQTFDKLRHFICIAKRRWIQLTSFPPSPFVCTDLGKFNSMNKLSKTAIVDKHYKHDETLIKKENTSVIEKVSQRINHRAIYNLQLEYSCIFQIWNWFETYGVFLLLLSLFGLHLAYPILCQPCHLTLIFLFLLVTYGLATLAKAFNIIGVKSRRKCCLWTSIVFAIISVMTALVLLRLKLSGIEESDFINKNTFAVFLTQLYVVSCNMIVISDAWTKLEKLRGNKP